MGIWGGKETPSSSKYCLALISIRIEALTRDTSCHGCILQNYLPSWSALGDKAYIVRSHSLQSNANVIVGQNYFFILFFLSTNNAETTYFKKREICSASVPERKFSFEACRNLHAIHDMLLCTRSIPQFQVTLKIIAQNESHCHHSCVALDTTMTHHRESSSCDTVACVATTVVWLFDATKDEICESYPIGCLVALSPPIGARRGRGRGHPVPCGKFTGSGAKFQPSAKLSSSARELEYLPPQPIVTAGILCF